MNVDLTERITLAAKANLPFTLNRIEISEVAELLDSIPAEEFAEFRSDIEVAAKERTGNFRLTAAQAAYVASLI